MTEIRCMTCKNYNENEGICAINTERLEYGDVASMLDVLQINRIWGITFQDCTKYEEIR